MQEARDIFSEIWPDLRAMASEIGQDYETVRKWRQRKRIPEHAWSRIIEKAALRGQLVTVSDLYRSNKSTKRAAG